MIKWKQLLLPARSRGPVPDGEQLVDPESRVRGRPDLHLLAAQGRQEVCLALLTGARGGSARWPPANRMGASPLPPFPVKVL